MCGLEYGDVVFIQFPFQLTNALGTYDVSRCIRIPYRQVMTSFYQYDLEHHFPDILIILVSRHINDCLYYLAIYQMFIGA